MSDIDEVKSRLDIVDVIGAKVTLKKAGRNFKALCPFHNEKTPSFIVSPDRQTFKCFGCGKGGSVIDFIMEYEHLDFVEALELLADQAGVKLSRRPADSPEASLRKQIFTVNHLASEYYHYLLTSHRIGQRAREYLKNRGVTDKTIKTFMLGYSPDSWEGLRTFLTKKGYDQTLLDKAGLIVASPKGGYDRFRGRVMFTLRDHRNNIVGFSGRLLDPKAKEAKYINTPETPVYSKSNVLYGLEVTKSAIQKENEALVMEGEFDVISSFQEGIANAVAIKGSALTEGHVTLLKRFAEKLTFALDSDLAGDAAARRGIEIAERAGLDLKVVVIPEGKDPDEAVRENAAVFKKAVKDAVPVYDYYISSATRRYDTSSPYGKKRVGTELMPVLAKIENPILQAHYIKKLAAVLDVDEEVIVSGIKRVLSQPEGVSARLASEQEMQPADLTRPEKLELYILALILQSRTTEFFEELKENVPVAEFTHPGVGQILRALDGYVPTVERFLIRDFADSLPKELLPVFDEAFLWDMSGFVEDDELVSREWMKALYELRRSTLRKKIKNLTVLLQNDHAPRDESESESVRQTLAKLTNDLRTLEKSGVF